MHKGLIGPRGQEGIKQLASGTKVAGQVFQYEVKVLSKELVNYRLYGNYNKELGQIVFTHFGKALHK